MKGPGQSEPAAQNGDAASGQGERPAGFLYVIPPERMPEALARLDAMNAFLAEIQALGLELRPPSMVFDPSWDDR